MTVSILHSPVQAQSNAEIVFWESVRDSGKVEMLELYLTKYPKGAFKDIAEMIIGGIENERSSVLGDAVEKCDALAGNPSDTTLRGPGVSFKYLAENSTAAIAACTQALDSGQPRQYYQLGRAYLAAENNTKGIKYYRQASEQGHLLATFWVAEYTEKGRYGVEQDIKLAIKIHEGNAKNGEIGSTFELGQMYRYGANGLEKDYDKALRYFRITEKAEYHASYFAIGEMLMFGLGVSIDKEQGIQYLQKSLEVSDFQASFARKYIAAEYLKTAEGYFDYEEFLDNASNTTGKYRDSYYYYSDKNGFEHLLAQALHLTKDRTNDDDEVHDEYITLLIKIISEGLYFERNPKGNGRYGYNPETRAFEIEIFDLLHAALIARYENNRSKYSAYAKNWVLDLLEEYHDHDEVYKDYFEFSNWAEQRVKDGKTPTNCLDKNSDGFSDGNSYYYINLKNVCIYDVVFTSRLTITYDSAPSGNQKELRTIRLKPGEGVELTVNNSGTGRASARAEWVACYHRNGGFKAFDPSAWSATCESTSFYDYPPLDRSEEELGALIDRITAGY